MYEPLIARCCAATKNANAAVLLYRVAFWMPKAKVSHGSLKWVANSASQWCQQTGLSFDQYRRAIALLKTLGLVETEQHLFGGKNITHVRLTEKGWAVIGKPPPDHGTAAPPANGNSAYLGLCENAQLYIQGESSLENHNGESNIAFASAHAICSALEQKLAGKDKKESNPISEKNSADDTEKKFEKSLGGTQSNSTDAGVPNYTPDDILASTESPAPSNAISIAHPVAMLQQEKMQSVTPADLAARWKALINEKYGDYVPPFTSKEFGQLKTFIQGCPPGQAGSIFEHCLRDWFGFTAYAKENYAAFPLPDRPTLGFLMKYRAVAMNFALKKQAEKAAKEKAHATAKQSALAPKSAPVTPASKPPEKIPTPEPKMTKEELLASLTDGNIDPVNPTIEVEAGNSKKGGDAPKNKALTYDQMMALKEDEYYASLPPKEQG